MAIFFQSFSTPERLRDGLVRRAAARCAAFGPFAPSSTIASLCNGRLNELSYLDKQQGAFHARLPHNPEQVAVPSRRHSAPTLLTIALAAFVPMLAVGRPAESNSAILKHWLSTYNAAHDIDLKAFTQRYLGNPDVAYALDTREESGGFTLVRIESDEPLELTALVRERLSKALWQVTMTRASPGTLPLKRLRYRPLPMSSQADALSALDAFATRLAAADHFSGVLAVSTKGQTVFAKAWGLADRAATTPVSIDTPFLVASQGKMFTAVASCS